MGVEWHTSSVYMSVLHRTFSYMRAYIYMYTYTSIKGTLCKSFPTIPQHSGDFSEVKMLKIMPFHAVGILIGSFEKCNFFENE